MRATRDRRAAGTPIHTKIIHCGPYRAGHLQADLATPLATYLRTGVRSGGCVTATGVEPTLDGYTRIPSALARSSGR
jgi:hypothetical protein